jgi:predicted metal-binding membrane protein
VTATANVRDDLSAADGDRPHRPRRPLRSARPSPLLLTVIAGAWMLAIVAEVTGRARWVHHHELVEGTLPLWTNMALFVVAWQVHIAAMMLPSSLPLLTLFRRAARGQTRPHAAWGALVAGYLVVWTVFGVLALSGDVVLHDLAHRFPALDRPRVIAGGTLLIAGAFQFTALKDRCLQQCRHPAVFLMTNYRRGVRAAWDLGFRHGLHCVGCCWALMLVMFAMGIANLIWMAPFALLMYHEKTGRGSDRHSKPIGMALIALGAVVLVDPSWMPNLFDGTAADSHH